MKKQSNLVIKIMTAVTGIAVFMFFQNCGNVNLKAIYLERPTTLTTEVQSNTSTSVSPGDAEVCVPSATVICGTDAPPNNGLRPNSFPALNGRAQLIQTQNRQIVSYKLPHTEMESNHCSGHIVIGENPIGPDSGMLIETTISHTPGFIDESPSPDFCTNRSLNPHDAGIVWQSAPYLPDLYFNSPLAQALGNCQAFESEGQWWVNVRMTWNSPTNPPGSMFWAAQDACQNPNGCGEVMAYYAYSIPCN
jgi:hypothetical protein